MSHSSYLQRMTAALDAPLTPADRAALDAHVAECAACRATLDRLQTVDALLRAAPLTSAPAGFAGRVGARLAAREATPKVIWGGLTLALGAVGAAMFIAVPMFTVIARAGAIAALPSARLSLLDAAATSLIAMRSLTAGLWVTANALLEWAVGQPLIGGGALLTLALSGLWAYLFNRLSPEVGHR